MLIRRIVLNRDGVVLNEASVKVRDRTEALSRIANEQMAFPASGYDDTRGSFWARPTERETYIHRWRIVE
jgi:hypothetical protein